MSAAHIIETYVPAIILAMTPEERWGSASKGLNSSDAAIPTWFIISAGVAVVVLVASSIMVACKQKAHKK